MQAQEGVLLMGRKGFLCGLVGCLVASVFIAACSSSSAGLKDAYFVWQSSSEIIVLNLSTSGSLLNGGYTRTCSPCDSSQPSDLTVGTTQGTVAGTLTGHNLDITLNLAGSDTRYTGTLNKEGLILQVPLDNGGFADHQYVRMSQSQYTTVLTNFHISADATMLRQKAPSDLQTLDSSVSDLTTAQGQFSQYVASLQKDSDQGDNELAHSGSFFACDQTQDGYFDVTTELGDEYQSFNDLSSDPTSIDSEDQAVAGDEASLTSLIAQMSATTQRSSVALSLPPLQTLLESTTKSEQTAVSEASTAIASLNFDLNAMNKIAQHEVNVCGPLPPGYSASPLSHLSSGDDQQVVPTQPTGASTPSCAAAALMALAQHEYPNVAFSRSACSAGWALAQGSGSNGEAVGIFRDVARTWQVKTVDDGSSIRQDAQALGMPQSLLNTLATKAGMKPEGPYGFTPS